MSLATSWTLQRLAVRSLHTRIPYRGLCSSTGGTLSGKRRNATPALNGTKLDPSESFMTGTNAAALEQLQDKYSKDPSAVHPSWASFFKNLDAETPPGRAVPLSRVSRNRTGVGFGSAMITEGRDLFQMGEDTIKLMSLIRAYRHRGHLIADLDPLGIRNEMMLDFEKAEKQGNTAPSRTWIELQPAFYGFSDADLDREFVVSGEVPGAPVRRLREIVNRMQQAYCGTIGVECRHILNKDEKVWIASFMESEYQPEFSKAEKLQILRDLAEGELFERFLHMKYSTAKRFGLEGGEAIIPGLQAMVEHASQLGIENVVIGMSHRGRLNVLGQIAHKRLEQIFSEFTPQEDAFVEDYLGSGDVKYHLGTSSKRLMRSGKHVNFSLLANPSHLEAVDPVALGKTRAKQFFTGDEERSNTMCLQLHGDASFAGQGVIAETLELSDLHDYRVGGTIHVVINNQIGFTTDPRKARSSPYPTDVAKTVNVPIFHVNGDDIEAVVRVFNMAIDYRQRYHKDVVIDLFCYRRHGHNELDQPMFTQPHMYKIIKKHPTPLEVYSEKLISEGVLSKEEYKQLEKDILDEFAQKFEESKTYVHKEKDWLSSHWEGFKSEKQMSRIRTTGMRPSILRALGQASHTVPEKFKLHPLLRKIVNERAQATSLGENVDWATAENLAFGSLLIEGTSVRLAGQDSERGTFSQRHAVWHDQDKEETYTALNNLNLGPQAKIQAVNSNLSEMAALGFELGYSLESPNSLVLWEAQFGDFVNGAQVIIDQFVSSGERKWRRQTGLVLLLPHGYEGQGPEHSSGRIERFLQMSDDDADSVPVMDEESRIQIQECNWQVVNPSTPANYFHVLRRQVHREFRKPLIVFSPKSLLRHPLCKSNFEDFKEETRFQRVLGDAELKPKDPKDVKRVAFCSGKVYYDLLQERIKTGVDDVALVRVEQISPFPFDRVAQEAKKYSNAELVWTQEESKNMGAWNYVRPRFRTALGKLNNDEKRSAVRYIGRGPSAAPATGSPVAHKQEQRALIEETLA